MVLSPREKFVSHLVLWSLLVVIFRTCGILSPVEYLSSGLLTMRWGSTSGMGLSTSG